MQIFDFKVAWDWMFLLRNNGNSVQGFVEYLYPCSVQDSLEF